MSDEESESCKFHEMELDDRILKAIARLGWITPTLIQEKAIPLLIEGKDVLLRARTGSGKTAAFVIPVIQKILNSKHTMAEQAVKVLLLAPSKELCSQIHAVIVSLTCKCSQEVKCIDISTNTDTLAQKPLINSKPDIVIATPARALAHLKAGTLDLKSGLEVLVVDEADLIFSFGYESDMKKILSFMPTLYQAILASATLSDDVQSLKKLVLHNPVILKLEESDMAPSTQLTHYHLAAEEMEKAAILYSLLKLNLVRGKSIIFVNTVDRCYKLKLFLEQFAIPSTVLNSELPSAIRCHSVNQFNQGIYDIIIASDENVLENPDVTPCDRKSKRKKDKESGVARGIDFHYVSNVINFDFPLSINSYVHRAGRTARGNNEGSVLSFVSIRERALLNQVDEHLKSDTTDDSMIKAYQFKLEEVQAFQYRAKDAWKAVTKIAVREARLKEIKKEIFSCEKLKSYFEDNPRDLQILRHDKALHTVKVQPHLADVPEYIIPESLKRLSGIAKKPKKRTWQSGGSNTKNQSKKDNPLLAIELTKFNKKKKK